MSPPPAHTDGQKVKTKQPGQLPPKNVPYVLPPIFSRIVLACSAKLLHRRRRRLGIEPGLLVEVLVPEQDRQVEHVQVQALGGVVGRVDDVGREDVRQVLAADRGDARLVVVGRDDGQLDLVLVAVVVGLDQPLALGLGRRPRPHRDRLAGVTTAGRGAAALGLVVTAAAGRERENGGRREGSGHSPCPEIPSRSPPRGRPRAERRRRADEHRPRPRLGAGVRECEDGGGDVLVSANNHARSAPPSSLDAVPPMRRMLALTVFASS